MSQQIESKVIEIVSEHMQVAAAEITRDTHFLNDLNADSLDIVEFGMEFEDAFEISISDEDVASVKTVGQSIDLIAAHLARRSVGTID